MRESGQRRALRPARPRRAFLRIGAAIAVGTLATWGVALFGLGSLHRLFERDLANLVSLFDSSAGASLEDSEHAPSRE
jgi:hypothetical protein